MGYQIGNEPKRQLEDYKVADRRDVVQVPFLQC